MKLTSKKIIIPALAIAATVGVAGAGAFKVSAFGGGEQRDEMVQRIAERFNLDQSEVESFFEEVRAEHQQERQQEIAEKLEQAVADGTITAEQKALIEAKMAENQTWREQLESMSQDERKAAMEQHHQEMQDWADANGIELRDILGGPEKGGHRGFGQGEGQGPGRQAEAS